MTMNKSSHWSQMVGRHRRMVRMFNAGGCTTGEGQTTVRVETNHWPQRSTWVMSSKEEASQTDTKGSEPPLTSAHKKPQYKEKIKIRRS